MRQFIPKEPSKSLEELCAEVGITFDKTKPFSGIEIIDKVGNKARIKDLSLLNPFDQYYTAQNTEHK